VVVPAITKAGLERQLLDMMRELKAGMLGLTPQQFHERWNPAVEGSIKIRKKRGPKTDSEHNPKRVWALKAFDQAEREGRLEHPEKFRAVKQVIRDRMGAERRQVDRWFEQWRRERGQN
jgi:hypothetical protein